MGRRHVARVDENQDEIVKALRAIGCTVTPTHAAGKGFPDITVGWQGVNYLLEIKNPSKPKRDRQLTEDQVDWHREWRGQVAVVETVKEALEAIGIPFRGSIS